MHNTALLSLAYEVGQVVGDPSTSFLNKIKSFMNDRYDDALMRTGITTWSLASTGVLGDGDVPLLGLGKVIKLGATADAWSAKRNEAKANKYEAKYEFALGNFIIAGAPQQITVSLSRYGWH